MKVICYILVFLIFVTSVYACLMSYNQSKHYRPISLNELLVELNGLEFEPIDIQVLRDDISDLYNNRPEFDNKLFEIADSIGCAPKAIYFVIKFGFDAVVNSYRNLKTVIELIGKFLMLTPA